MRTMPVENVSIEYVVLRAGAGCFIGRAEMDAMKICARLNLPCVLLFNGRRLKYLPDTLRRRINRE